MIGKVRVLGNSLTIAKSKAMEDHGLFDTSRGTIYIRADLSPDVERHALLHELAHDMFYRFGLENDIDKPTTERFCDAFALYVRDLVKNNPKLIDYIKEK